MRSLYVTDLVQLVASEQLVKARGTSWTEIPSLSGSTDGHQWVAVAAVPYDGGLVSWALDQSGHLYRAENVSAGTSQLIARFPQPAGATYFSRAAATLPLPDGGALLGFGRSIVRLTGDRVLTLAGVVLQPDGGTLADGGLPPELDNAPVELISGLAMNDHILAVTGHLDPLSAARISKVFVHPHSAAPDAGWLEKRASNAGETFNDIVTCPSGDFVFAGDHKWLMRFDGDGSGAATNVWQTIDNPEQADGRGVDFASVWCGPGNEMWALTQHGDVYRYFMDRSFRRERTGWGRGRPDKNLGNTIRGNNAFVFITGDSQAVLSRPLCP